MEILLLGLAVVLFSGFMILKTFYRMRKQNDELDEELSKQEKAKEKAISAFNTAMEYPLEKAMWIDPKTKKYRKQGNIPSEYLDDIYLHINA
ncbi:MAG: hypothetical protein WCJ84_00520 [Candidatus Peregrinibacteria bacterium]